MWRMECASGWSNKDREVVLVVTGFITDTEEGFKTHGHFATRQKPSLLSRLMYICQAFAVFMFLICSLVIFSFHPSLLICWLIGALEESSQVMFIYTTQYYKSGICMEGHKNISYPLTLDSDDEKLPLKKPLKVNCVRFEVVNCNQLSCVLFPPISKS